MSDGPVLTHQSVVAKLLVALHIYLVQFGRERTVLPGPADIWWDDENLVQPDILVVVPEEMHGG